MKPITIVVGGQYGSEAKGAVAGWLALHDPRGPYDYAVRTGAVNAGHSVEYAGRVYVNQQLPVAWVNQDTTLIIGAGAIVEPSILERECRMIDAAMPDSSIKVKDRLIIDPRAYIHTPEHVSRSTSSGRHHRIGATGKGCSEAVIDRVRLRGIIKGQVKNYSQLLTDYCVADTERLLNDAVDAGARVMLEGTQGQLLDLALGPYPYTTHKQTGPAVWMAEAGLSPSLPVDIVMVVRTFPIRVAGNSGPLEWETSWPVLARAINQRRSEHGGLTPIVAPWAIAAFERAVVDVTADRFADKIPYRGDPLKQHQWTAPDLRERYAEALSEIHKAALDTLDDTTVAELRKLFEMTTVTKKLRRVARLSKNDLTTAARQIRPSRVAVTFMNYVFPEQWPTPDQPAAALTDEEHAWLIDNIETPCRPFGGAKVTLINRGPLHRHVVETGH